MADYLNYEYGFKLILLGDCGVGKSSLFRRYTKNLYHDNYDYTTTVDYEHMYEQIRGHRLKLTLWDTAGQERLHERLFGMYYRQATVALIVYDITRAETFRNAGRWLEMVRTYCMDEVTVALVGMKQDLALHRQVSTKEAKKFASSQRLQFWEVSAMHPTSSLPQIFQEPCKKVLRRVHGQNYTPDELAEMGVAIGRLHKDFITWHSSGSSDFNISVSSKQRQEEEEKLVEQQRKKNNKYNKCGC